jgi:Colicin V production protein.
MILIVLLLFGIFAGLRRGMILQIVHLTGFFVAFILAAMYYKDLAVRLTLWIPYPTLGGGGPLELISGLVNAEAAYYNGIAFFLIFIFIKMVWQMIGSMLDFLARVPVLRQINGWGGALLGFLEMYLVIFIFLYMAALLPIDIIQETIQNSRLAAGIIEHTPIFTAKIKDLWLK